MIRKLLIANRGEVAIRIIRTCRELGIATVAIYSDADANSSHLKAADEAVRIGAAPASESYLNIAQIVHWAWRVGADAVHPGFGFLAENAEFAQAVIDKGLTWIGPSPQAIRSMGDKRRAKLTLKDIPLVPGYSGEGQSDSAFVNAANGIGLPLLIKAAAGGGGKGMRRVDDMEMLHAALDSARGEAGRSFGSEMLILEKYMTGARHIEIQILGDTFGNVIALGERECSIQRRHQKIIEECPSPAVEDALRAWMSEVAVGIGKQLKYVSAGTVEFLLDSHGEFYFIEMNTRLQVEHAVTEMVYGVDLVALQIQIAEGGNLRQLVRDAIPSGHAIEARIYSEDPSNEFLPAIGKILLWDAPDNLGVRVDSGIETGSEVTVHYDPMVAKIIAHAPTDEEAARKLDYALSKTVLLGVKHNIRFLRNVLAHEQFVSGDFDTDFIDQHPELTSASELVPYEQLALVTLAISSGAATNWRNNGNTPVRNHFRVGSADHWTTLSSDGEGDYQIHIGEQAGDTLSLSIEPAFHGDGKYAVTLEDRRMNAAIAQGEENLWWVNLGGTVTVVEWIDPLPVGRAETRSAGSLRAPMPGQVISVRIEIGQSVLKGDILMVIEAMKMEHRIAAPYDGTVIAVHFKQGQTVQQGVTLLDLQASNPE